MAKQRRAAERGAMAGYNFLRKGNRALRDWDTLPPDMREALIKQAEVIIEAANAADGAREIILDLRNPEGR